MSRIAQRVRPRTFRILGGFVLAAAFVLTPLVVGAVSASYKLRPASMPPYDADASVIRPVHDDEKLTAVIVAGVEGTESSDLLAPFQVLAASGEFNVYTAAPERTLMRLFPGSPHLAGVDMIPHFSFDEYDQIFTNPPDLIVVPYIPSTSGPVDRPILDWLRANTGEETLILSICGGAQVVADAGLMSGRTATTHRNILSLIEAKHPDVTLIRGQRWVEDGNLISSAGITSGIDATLRAIERLSGRDVAERAAHEVDYPYLRYLDDPSFELPERATVAPLLNLAYRWETETIGMMLYDGVDELSLASVTDTYPRGMMSEIHSIGLERRPIVTKYGLVLVARSALADSPSLDRVIVPGVDVPPSIVSALDNWSLNSAQPAAELLHESRPGEYVFDAALRDLARGQTQAIAGVAAAGLEYPIEHLELPGERWPYALLLRPLLIGVIGVGLVVGGRELWRNRSAVAPVLRRRSYAEA